MVLPVAERKEVWWTVVSQHMVSSTLLARRGDRGVLMYPGKKGWSYDESELKWDLVDFRLCFR